MKKKSHEGSGSRLAGLPKVFTEHPHVAQFQRGLGLGDRVISKSK